jgi:hypothetical protein
MEGKPMNIFEQYQTDPELISDVNLEATGRTEDIICVRIAKLGGGTLGKAYAGHWLYRVTLPGDVIVEGQDFHTGTPKTHHEATVLVAEFVEDRYPGIPTMDGTLAISQLSERAKLRHGQALWYVWGRQDAGDERTKGNVAGHYLGDDFAFADMAAREAEEYEQEKRVSLENIGDQFKRFVETLS